MLARIILARGLKLPFEAVYIWSIDGAVPQHDVGNKHKRMFEPLDYGRGALVFSRGFPPTDTSTVSTGLTFD